MKHTTHGIVILALLALPLLLASCGSDGTSSPSKANLTVLDVAWNPSSPNADEPITVTITVKNAGEADAPASSTRLKVNGTSTCAAIATPAIAKGQQANVTCDIGTRTAGAYVLEASADVASLIDESDESDNKRTANMTVAAVSTSDLIVQAVTFTPDPPVANQPVTAHIVVRNQGTASAAASMTSTEVGGTTACSGIATGTILAGETESVDCALGVFSAGTHSLQACADASTTVTESNEANNCLVVDLIVSPPDTPDLVVQGITFTPELPVVDQEVTAHIVIRNQGTGPSVASFTRTTADGESKCEQISTPIIEAGQTTTVECVLGTFTSGTHVIAACADNESDVNESNESNNCLDANLIVSPVASQPDLIVDGITFTPAQPTAGQAVSAHIVVRNQGAGAAATSVTSSAVDGTPKCAAIATAIIASGSTVTVDCALGTFAAGTFQVLACADAASALGESNEGNNCLTVSLTVNQAAAQPDLIIDGITFTPAQPTTSDPVTAHVVVRNQGTGAAQASTTSVSANGTTTCPSVATTTIAAGATATIDCLLGTFSAGTHSAAACADVGSVVTETSEANNCLTVNFEVSSVATQPDLVIQSIELNPQAPNEGQTIIATVTVRNSGSALAGSTKTRVRVDEVTSCAELSTLSIPAGATATVICTFGPLTAGEHSIEACADITTQVAESNESNNCTTTPVTVTTGLGFPAFPAPVISTCVNFQSEDANALAAQTIVQNSINMTAFYATLITAFLPPIQNMTWSDEGGGCWLGVYVAGECNWSYRVCQTGEGWEWTLTVNGTCDTDVYDNWVAFRGTMNNADGTEGTLRFYESGTTTVITSVVWDASTDRRSGTWNMYDGDFPGGTLSSQLEWAKNPDDSQDTTLLIPEGYKEEIHISADCKTGLYEYYEWLGSPADWVKKSEIRWTEGTGYQRTYDDTGTLDGEVTW